MSYEFPTHPPRPTDAERERAIEVLREGAVDGRLSHDTFVRRMGLALEARHSADLAALIADLPPPQGRWARLTGSIVRAVTKTSAFRARMRLAWAVQQLPPLLLPAPGPFPVRIGRDLSCTFRLSHSSTSRFHAELSHEGGLWVLRDLGSMNGTWVNGHRVMGAAAVRPGDQVTFGAMSFRLTTV
ncbi:FHA domain-containing protein [Actinacidiphila glaucinigra]|uniref:FHA domain-containing protein n=1 Tax=Actinacidiphila glaucinigra TaxID=235986 RepID=UPI003865D3A3